ncbi:MAG: hypothetical protein ACI4HQ_14350 [Acetatifactor sp.]
MKEKVKSYFAVTSTGYRLFVFGLMPLVFVGLYAVFSEKVRVLMLFLPFAEIVADSFFLGGIQEKDAEGLDYLRSSSRGMRVVRGTLVVDLIRRFFTAMLVLGLCCVMKRLRLGKVSAMEDFVFPLLLCYSLSLLGILITRFRMYHWVNFAVGYTTSVISIALLFLLTGGVIGVLLGSAIFAVLSVFFSVVAVKLAMKRVEGGYYDK